VRAVCCHTGYFESCRGHHFEMLRLHSGWHASVLRQFATVLGVGNHDIAVVGPRMWEPRAIKHVERNR
jgi:hypothetical protein